MSAQAEKDTDESGSHDSSLLGSEDPLDRDDWLSVSLERLAATFTAATSTGTVTRNIPNTPTSKAAVAAHTSTSEIEEARQQHQFAFTVVTWNLWFSPYKWQARLESAIWQTLQHDPDVICYQEVTTDVHNCMLSCRYLRERYVPTEDRLPSGYDCSIWIKANSPDRKSTWHCTTVPQNAMQSIYGRRGLCVDLEITCARSTIIDDSGGKCQQESFPHTYRIRVMTAHLESGKPMAATRRVQLEALFSHIQGVPRSTCKIEGGDEGGHGIKSDSALVDASLFVGDFNLDPSYTENEIVDANGIDLWKALRPNEAGYTEDTYKNRMRYLAHGEHKQVRYDRVILIPTCNSDNRSDLVGLRAEPLSIDLLGTEPFDRDGQIWVSDHFGLAGRICFCEGKKSVLGSPSEDLTKETNAVPNANTYDGYITP